MKRKFIFLLTMCIFGLTGLLKAQDDVATIGGDATSYQVGYPIAFNYNYQLSQHVYTASEINHAAGIIEKIAFKVNVTQTRNLTFYLKNTTTSSLTNWESYTDADMVFHSDAISTAPTDGWVTFELDTPFEYTGGNILLVASDNTGSYTYTYQAGNAYQNLSRNATFYVNGTNPVSASGGFYSTRQPSIRFTFGEVQDDLEPAVPANLTATAIDHASVSLTWDAAENAKSYNVYKNGTLVSFTSTTSYLVEDLDANTQYCFTVTGVRGAKESDASNEACATTAKAPLIKEVLVGAGDATGEFIPTYTYYNYSTTQQIYTAEELGFGAGNVTKIAFYNNGSAVSRNIDVYITNTTKANFTGSSNMVNMTAEDKVYSGTYTFTSGWCEIAFSKAFEYTGGNILICVDDNTGTWVVAPTFKANTKDDIRANYYWNDYTNYDPLNVAGKSTTSLKQNNQIKFFVEAEPEVTPNVEAVNFAEVIRLGNYWSEKYTAPSVEVQVKNIGADITSIESSNDFFVLSENIDLTASNIVFNVTCKTETSYAGTQNGNIVISYEIEGEASTVEIPVSATAYAPEQADVIELATNVTFTEGTYTNTPDFATLHDDYILPGEATEGSTPDAVYHFTMENEGTLTVNVTGTNAVAAVYKAGDIDLENEIGPSSNNNYEGEVAEVAPTAPTSFFYDFEDGSLEDFNLVEYDGNNNSWSIVSDGDKGNTIISYSYYYNGIYFNQADNYIITKDLYAVTANSKLTMDAKCNGEYNGWDEVMVKVSTNGEEFVLIETVKPASQTWVSDLTVDLGAKFTEKGLEYGNYYIALHHQNSDIYSIQIDNLRLSDGSTKSRSTEPQINAVQYPAGEYYLVAAAEDAFSVTIETATLPAPESVTYTAPENGAMEQNNPKLSWTFGNYTSEYQVLLGTTNPPTDVVVDWTSELATSFQTEALANQTTYYWQVNAKNATGTTAGEVYSFITPLNQATELAVTDAELYPGETTTLTWTAAEDALSYNVYVNDTVKLNATSIEGTSFELTNLPHNVNPGNAITVTAVHTLGESAHSEAVYVKMAGGFNLVVNVKDAEGNAIENAAVAFNTESYYDEYYQLVPAVETLYTDAEGKATKTLAMPCVYGSPYWYYSNLEVVISKEYATEKYVYITSYTGGLSAGQDYVQNITLEYIAPQNVQADKYYYVEGEDMVLTWNEVEGAVGYNVYKVGYSYEIYDYVYTLVNEEAITDTTFTVENLKYDLESLYVTYAVTADYGFGESAKNAKVYPGVTGEGQIAGNVTDGTNPIKGAKVTIVGYDGFDRPQTYTFVTNEDGEFTGDMLIGSYYTATVSHYDYNEKVIENVAIEYQTELPLDIVLEAKQKADFDVTAVESGDYVNVTWGAAEGATSYNVYRRDSEGNVQRIYSDVTSLTATDYYWSTLETGTYEYGVSATVNISNSYTEGFENGGNLPEGWTIYHTKTSSTYDWIPTTYAYNQYPIVGNYAVYSNTNGNGSTAYGDFYLVAPLYDLTGAVNPQLTFYRHSPDYYTSNYSTTSWTNTLKVFVSTESATGPWTEVYSNNNNTIAWSQETVSLAGYEDQQVYIAFCTNVNYGRCTAIDNVVFPSISISSESAVNWSAPIEKQASIEFTNAAGDNNWSNEANWSTGAVPQAGENVMISTNANLNTIANVANMKIAGSATLTLNDGAELTVTGTITQVYDSYTYTTGKLVINDGAQIFQSNESVYATFNMNMENPSEWGVSEDGWQFIASPFNSSSITNFTGLSWAPKSYDLYKFEGAEEGAEWNNHKDGNFEDAFVNGRGYLASYETLTTATLSGYLYNKDNFDFTEVTYTEGKELANFHLLGNPFSFDMDWSKITVENVYEAFATVDSTGGYIQRINGTIPVGDGFFVKAKGENPSISYNAGSKSRGENVEYINVVASGKQGSNNVIIKLSGKEEKGFSKLENLNQSIADIYVKNNGRQYSVLGYDNDVKEVELFFDAKEMGNYTIGIEPNGKFQSVTLVDRMTGAETNMLLDSYTFTATANDNPNRFLIRLDNGQSATDGNFVYQSGEELIVDAEGTIQIIDVMGRMVYSNDVESSNNRINVSNLKGATYIVRNISNNTVRTQKIVIL
ncbi:MAG: choice-of-anchor J domain-containing protein [Bacteroidales bacterium]|nr:choice-of-anchor J domain-containing protein [Bacteroidales bacterium]